MLVWILRISKKLAAVVALKYLDLLLKAALISICILTMDEMTLGNVKRLSCSDKPAEKHTLQFPFQHSVLVI